MPEYTVGVVLTGHSLSTGAEHEQLVGSAVRLESAISVVAFQRDVVVVAAGATAVHGAAEGVRRG